jgi:hypothetical protein
MIITINITKCRELFERPLCTMPFGSYVLEYVWMEGFSWKLWVLVQFNLVPIKVSYNRLDTNI